MLNPFEGMGVESRWEFKMPRFSNRMDFNQIADVLIEVEYTAMDSFQYRYQVLQELDNTLYFNRGFSFKNDFPDQWYELAEAIDGTDLFFVEFEIKRNNFPQGLNDIRLNGEDILLHFVREDGFTDEITVYDFCLADNQVDDNSKDTVEGTYHAGLLTQEIQTSNQNSPFVKLKLAFNNSPLNIALFSEEKVQDILLLISCKADLPNYPL